MATGQILTKKLWKDRTDPSIWYDVEYEYRREGENMFYRFRVHIYPMQWKNSRFGYNIKFWAQVGQNADDHPGDWNYCNAWLTVKDSSPSSWGSYQGGANDGEGFWTGWSNEVNVGRKVDGSTPCYVCLYSDNGSNRNEVTGKHYLPIIPATTSINSFSVNSIDETAVRFNWSAAHTIDQLQYSISTNDTEHWSTIYNLNTSSGYFDVNNLSAGTSYKCKIKVRRKDSGLWTGNSETKGTETYKYPYVISNPNFIIGNEVTVSIHNPLQRSCTLSVINNKNESKTIDTITSTTITIPNNTEWKNFFYNSIPDSNEGNYKIRLVSPTGNTNVVSEISKYTIDTSLSEIKPIFTENNITNIRNLANVSIAGSTKFIQDHNLLVGMFDPMEPQCGAEGDYYLISSSQLPTVRKDYVENDSIYFDLGNVKINNFTITAVDTRGNPTTINKTIELIDYKLPMINRIKITRQNGIGTKAIIDCIGTYTNWENLLENNSIQNIKYKINDDNEWHSLPSTAEITNQNGIWTLYVVLDDTLSTTDEYNLYLQINDKIDNIETIAYKISTADAFLWKDIGNKKIGINKKPDYALDVNGDINTTGKFRINGVELIPGGGGNQPTKLSDLENDTGFITKSVDNLENYTTTDDLSNSLNNKVDKVTGKELSTNDYTTAEKTKLSNISAGAQVNTIETVKVDGTALTPDSNKAVNIILPDVIQYKDYSSNKNFKTLSTGIYKVNGNNLSLTYDIQHNPSWEGYDNSINLVKDDIIIVQRKGTPSSTSTIPTYYLNDFFIIQGSINKSYKLINIEEFDSSGDSGYNYSWQIDDLVSTKITKVSQLTNDSNFQSNVIETVKVNNVTLTPNNKSVNIDLSNYYDKSEVDSKISSVYRYKGSVNNYSNLPTTDLTIGDVYNIINADSTHNIKAGDNVSWTGSDWDVLSGIVDLSEYYNKTEIDTSLSNKLSFTSLGKVNDYNNSSNALDFNSLKTNTIYAIDNNSQDSMYIKISFKKSDNTLVSPTYQLSGSAFGYIPFRYFEKILDVNEDTIISSDTVVGYYWYCTMNFWWKHVIYVRANGSIMATGSNVTPGLSGYYVSTSPSSVSDYSSADNQVLSHNGSAFKWINNPKLDPTAITGYIYNTSDYGWQQILSHNGTNNSLKWDYQNCNFLGYWGRQSSIGYSGIPFKFDPNYFRNGNHIGYIEIRYDATTTEGQSGDFVILNDGYENMGTNITIHLDNVISPIFVSKDENPASNGENIGVLWYLTTRGYEYIRVYKKYDVPSAGAFALRCEKCEAYASVAANITTTDIDNWNAKRSANNTICTTEYTNKWLSKVWNGLTSFYGYNIWTDGENIYYSGGTNNHYVLNKLTKTWTPKVWNGLTDFSGGTIWTDGENIYASRSSGSTGANYVLDKATSTWSTKEWNGLTIFSGPGVWTDGDNIYYSNSSTQYVLNKSTSTWNVKTWSGNYQPGYGAYIWTDGENIYYSGGTNNHYVLNKLTKTWTPKVWNGLTDFSGEYVWTDGKDIYYSYPYSGGGNYVLDKATSTWSTKTWTGYTSLTGNGCIWSDGENVYYSVGSAQYVLNSRKSTVQEEINNLKQMIASITDGNGVSY